MTIALHQKTRFRGRTSSFSTDQRDLGALDVGAHPSSLELGPLDAALLFRQRDWDGGCIYRRGPARIEDLGSSRDGGQLGFGNTIASVRVTPFTIRLNVTLVSTRELVLPGSFSAPARDRLDEIVAVANAKLADERALLELVVSGFNVRQSDVKFDVALPRAAWYRSEWKVAGELDVVIADSTGIGAAAGVTKPPALGQVLLLAASLQFGAGFPPSTNLPTATMGFTLVHELAHFLGVHHHSAKNLAHNIMGPPPDLDPFTGEFASPAADRHFTEEQLENMHATLARHPARRLNRRGD